MTPALPQSAAALPVDPVASALADPEVGRGLLEHALAVLGRRLADRPAVVRSEEAGDAVQDTGLRALQKRDEYAPVVGPVSGWLHGILNKVLCERVRSLIRLPGQAPASRAAWERLAADLATHPADAVPDRLTASDYLAKLPAEHQEVLRLRFYGGLSHEELAARLGISPGNARVRLCRALAAAKAMAGEGGR
jgi:RNA polymerase sigma-70 factor (ECF subfamily)